MIHTVRGVGYVLRPPCVTSVRARAAVGGRPDPARPAHRRPGRRPAAGLRARRRGHRRVPALVPAEPARRAARGRRQSVLGQPRARQARAGRPGRRRRQRRYRASRSAPRRAAGRRHGSPQAAIVADDGTNRSLAFPAADTAALTALVAGRRPASASDLDAVGDYRRATRWPVRTVTCQITGLPLHSVERDPALGSRSSRPSCSAHSWSPAGVTARGRRTADPAAAGAVSRHRAARLRAAAHRCRHGVADQHRAGRPAAARSDQVSVAFDHMLDHVESALAARDGSEDRLRQFVADASHELRTPLATIRGARRVRGASPTGRRPRRCRRGARPDRGGDRPDGHPGQTTCCCSPGSTPAARSPANRST